MPFSPFTRRRAHGRTHPTPVPNPERTTAAPIRRTSRLVVAALVVAVAAAGCAGASSTQSSPPVRISAPASDLHAATLGTPFREPDVTLTGTSGRPVNLLQATKGKLTLMYFGYTHCPDLCPTMMADLAGALRLLTYNLVKRQAEVEILPFAEAENMGVVTYSPLGAGLLTGKYGTGRYGLESDFATADRFTAFAREMGVKPATLAVAWAMSHPAVTAPIIGARNLSQREDSLEALDVEMTGELREKISALSPTPAPATDRTETLKSNWT